MNYTISVTQLKKGNYYISLMYQGKRYRFYNGNAIGLKKSPNRYPVEERTTPNYTSVVFLPMGVC